MLHARSEACGVALPPMTPSCSVHVAFTQRSAWLYAATRASEVLCARCMRAEERVVLLCHSCLQVALCTLHERSEARGVRQPSTVGH